MGKVCPSCAFEDDLEAVATTASEESLSSSDADMQATSQQSMRGDAFIDSSLGVAKLCPEGSLKAELASYTAAGTEASKDEAGMQQLSIYDAAGRLQSLEHARRSRRAIRDSKEAAVTYPVKQEASEAYHIS